MYIYRYACISTAVILQHAVMMLPEASCCASITVASYTPNPLMSDHSRCWDYAEAADELEEKYGVSATVADARQSLSVHMYSSWHTGGLIEIHTSILGMVQNVPKRKALQLVVSLRQPY